VLEEGFELEFEAGLALNGIFIRLGDAFEEDALILGGLPDGLEFVEAQEAGQGEGIAFVMFVVAGAVALLKIRMFPVARRGICASH
jgi:hypothetical protein